MDCHLPRLELAYLIDRKFGARRTFLEIVMGRGVYGRPSSRSGAGGQNWLRQLRGDGNTDARMRIARALGVPSGRELGRLRRVRVVLAEVEQAEERKGRWCGGSDY